MKDEHTTIIRPRPGGKKTSAASIPKPSGSLPPREMPDQTIVKPRPGKPSNPDRTVITPRRRDNARAVVTSVTTGEQHNRNLLQDNEAPTALATRPALLTAAAPALNALSQIRQLRGVEDLQGFRRHLADVMHRFRKEAALEESQDVVSHASYALCATLDEAILNSRWGENSDWSQQPLLSEFHQETYGGERFYKILDDEVVKESRSYSLIELLYLCLSLGFLGKLRVDPQGSAKYETLRKELYRILKIHALGDNNLQGTDNKPHTAGKALLNTLLPIWIFIGALALVGLIIYRFWLLDLNNQSDDVIRQLNALVPAPTESVAYSEDQRIIALRELLRPEIERKLVSVEPQGNTIAISLIGEELFESGSTQVHSSYDTILDKISKALEAREGQIKVIGHTDNQYISSVRFPSNWHLSLARANSVTQHMSQAAELHGRIIPEGRGDTEPKADNSTPEGRMANRRVVIELTPSDVSPQRNLKP